MRFEIPHILAVMERTLGGAGFKSYLVGGAVRDTLMGLNPHDYDVATDASPKDVIRLFRRTIPTGIKHGTVTVRLFGQSIETTTFRTEGAYTDGRHPDKWTRAATIEDDLARRDFTMNAIAVDLATGSVIDPYNGQEDISLRLIRAVGDAKERFTEDGLRPIRAIRFAAQTGFSIEEATYSAIADKDVAAKAAGVSIERFRDEFVKMISSPNPAPSLKMLEDTGMKTVFLSDVDMDIAASAAPFNITVRLAALFHGMGAQKARKVLTRLRFSNSETDGVSHLIANYSFDYDNWSDADVRRFVVRVGKENIENVLALRLCCGKSKAAEEGLRDRIAKTRCDVLSLKDLTVTGNDIIKAGIKAGPNVGKVLDALFQHVLEKPEDNTKEGLLKKVVSGKWLVVSG